MFTTTTVTADRGSIAAGGDVIGYTAEQVRDLITAATDPLWKRTDEQRDQICQLEHQLGANEEQVLTFFRIIGEAQVAPDRIGEKLVEIAERYKLLLTQVAPAPGDDPEVARLNGEAKAALDAGNPEQADALLERVLAARDAAAERQQLEAAATSAQRGNIALTRLRYREAAQHFAAAARRVPREHEEQALAYLDQEADALYRQGDEFGDNTALAGAIYRYRALLKHRTRERVPLDWARTQNKLGMALACLGERETGKERLENAVAAFSEALQEWTRERVPFDWAKAQNNLGNALVCLGERESGTERLEKAVEAYRAALQEWTRERVPLRWAGTQTALGAALRVLGKRESGAARLKEAVKAYHAALQERKQERVPFRWAETQNNLGATLRLLGERENDTEQIRQAAQAYRAALQVYTREAEPLRWAETQNNLGLALMRLGERENDTERLRQAVEAFLAALNADVDSEYHKAMFQHNLLVALSSQL